MHQLKLICLSCVQACEISRTVHSCFEPFKYHRSRNNIFECKIVNIFLSINLTFALGAQKNLLMETVLLSTHNICFGR